MEIPEDVAIDKYFTPPTLTRMLRDGLNMEPKCDAEARAIEENLNLIKSVLKKWLRTVGLPDYVGLPETRKLLITLVDEP